MEDSDLSRVIAINLEKLEQGDWRQNIVIRENDIIQVPNLRIGEFYVAGEVLRPGVYDLTGRRVTIKMALAAAGNLGPLAWPENSVLIRRIGKNQEQQIPIDVERIFRGEDPDIFLKPNDIVAVGTHPATLFIAVMRNAFRMTYGFGFIYDRNFADPLYTSPTSNRFTRW
jgi:protein involved in polysaccharide export with SLBB domain